MNCSYIPYFSLNKYFKEDDLYRIVLEPNRKVFLLVNPFGVPIGELKEDFIRELYLQEITLYGKINKEQCHLFLERKSL